MGGTLGEWVTVAVVLRPHGLSGAVKVRMATDNPNRFRTGARLFLLQGGQAREVLVERFVAQGPYGLVKLAELGTPAQAQAWRGAELAVPLEELEALPPGRYYTFQILGLKVVTAEGRELGTIGEIENMPASDVYRVEGPEGCFYIPACGDIIRQVDLDRGQMIIDDREGLR